MQILSLNTPLVGDSVQLFEALQGKGVNCVSICYALMPKVASSEANRLVSLEKACEPRVSNVLGQPVYCPERASPAVCR